MTSQSSGGSGSGLPGVTSDGLTPGGLNLAGALTAGDATAADVPTFHTLYGNTVFHDVIGGNVDDDDVIDVQQNVGLTADSGANGLRVIRNGALNGHNYTSASLWVNDATASTAPVASFYKGGILQYQVDSDGVQVHGKFKVGSAVTHTLGAYSGKSLPIYDESGTLVGYAPCYA